MVFFFFFPFQIHKKNILNSILCFSFCCLTDFPWCCLKMAGHFSKTSCSVVLWKVKSKDKCNRLQSKGYSDHCYSLPTGLVWCDERYGWWAGSKKIWFLVSITQSFMGDLRGKPQILSYFLLGIRNKGLLASEGWKESRKQQGKLFCSIWILMRPRDPESIWSREASEETLVDKRMDRVWKA